MKITVTPEDVNDFCMDGDNEFELIEVGDFVQEHKYQNATNIYKQLSTGKMFALDISRSGSYHSDWYYSYEDAKSLDLYEVEKVEVTTYEWKQIK